MSYIQQTPSDKLTWIQSCTDCGHSQPTYYVTCQNCGVNMDPAKRYQKTPHPYSWLNGPQHSQFTASQSHPREGWTLDLRTHSGLPQEQPLEPDLWHQPPRPPHQRWLPWVLVAATLANWLAVLKWLNS